MQTRSALAVAGAILLLVVAVVVTRVSMRTTTAPRASSTGAASTPTARLTPPAIQHDVIVHVMAGGQAVVDATVQLYGPRAEPREHPEQAQTSSHGSVRFSRQAAGHYLVVVHHPLYAAGRQEIELVAASTEIAVDLERGVVVAGDVVDERGKPVPDATVRAIYLLAQEREPSPADQAGSARTNAAGRFEVGPLPLSSYRIYVHTGRHRPRFSEPVVFEKNGDRREVRVVVEEGLAVRGRVIDAERRPIAGATVGASDQGALLANSDDDGRFQLFGLGKEPINLFATAQGFAPAQLPRIAPGRRDVEIVMQLPARLTGALRLAEPGARSVRLDLCRWDDTFRKELCVHAQVYEPPSESFELRNLPSGMYDLVISVDDRVAMRRAVTLEPGRTVALEIDVPAIAP